MNMTQYERRVLERSKIQYIKGYVLRLLLYSKFSFRRFVAKKKGASIGKEVVFSYWKTPWMLTNNFKVGDFSEISDCFIDQRLPISIGSHTIIGKDVTILCESHNVDSEEWETKKYGLEIDDYVWIAPGARILPSCRYIGYGAVIGGGLWCTVM